MTGRRSQAHALLDRAKYGGQVDEESITHALLETGDLGGSPIRIYRPAGSWERAKNAEQMFRPAEPFDGLVA